MAERYRYDFSWESPYGRMVGLLRERVDQESVILDLGCGFGPVAEPLAELGVTYVGCDLMEEGLASLAERGFETHTLDLADLPRLQEQIVKIVGGRDVGAVLLLDALEHLPDVHGFLGELRKTCLELERPVLGVSIPNVGHFDVGAKLIAGRWDVTPAGLLDITHLQFFTEARMTAVLASAGWFEMARDDLALHHSDQHFPPDHPALADGTPLRDFLWRLRQRSDGYACVNQFVRVFALASTLPPEPAAGPAPDLAAPFLTVLMRTQGRRMANLLEALTCLAAQTDDDLEVLLLVHSARDDVTRAIRELVASFAPEFTVRVKVHQVADGDRAHPLNVGLDRAAGRYLAFLDDDDLVTADWVHRFREGAQAAPGRVVRSITLDRRVRRLEGSPLGAVYLPDGPLEAKHALAFNALEHLHQNQTPNCSFAVPIEAIRAVGARFDEELPVLEDWEFLMSLALLCGVHDTGYVTSIYHRWAGKESSLGSVSPTVWDTSRRAILQRLDAGPIVLPRGSATRVAALWEAFLNVRQAEAEAAGRQHRIEQQERREIELTSRLDEARTNMFDRIRGDLREAYWRDLATRQRDTDRLEAEVTELRRRLAESEGEANRARAELRAIRNSRSWQASSALGRLLRFVRQARP